MRAGHIFKKVVGISSISGSIHQGLSSVTGIRPNGPALEIENFAEVIEHQELEGETNRWLTTHYEFESGGSSCDFPTEKEYIERVDDGFDFSPSTAWEMEGSWVEGVDYDTEKSGKGRRRKRAWRRPLVFVEKKSEVGEDSSTHVGPESDHEKLSAVANQNSFDVGASFRSASKILNANEQNTKHTRTMLGLKEIGVEGGNRLQMRTADREARGTVIGGLGEFANGESIDIDSEGDSRSTDGEEEGTYDEEGYDECGDSAEDASVRRVELESNFGDGADLVDDNASVNPASATRASSKGRPGRAEIVREKAEVEKKVSRLLKDEALKKKNRKVREIAKQLRVLEKESERIYEAEKAEWRNNSLPRLQEQVAALEERVAQFKSRLEDEAVAGVAHQNMLEEELLAHTEVLEDTKKKMYFPFSPISLGSGGVYMAFDDIWLENMSGQVNFSLQPNRDKPYISLVLEGFTDGGEGEDKEEGDMHSGKEKCEEGMKVTFKIDHFKSAGDKGKNVPRTTLAEVKVRLSLIVNVLLYFDTGKKVWCCDGGDDFRMELLKFRGPFGTGKNMVNGILNLMAPKIMAVILEILPRELGELISSLPSPTELRGHFEVKGTPLTTLSEPMANVEEMCRACESSPRQLTMFLAMQRYCMERGSYHELKTVNDVLAYIKKYRRNTRIWRNICWCWEQCCSLYCEQVQVSKAEEAMRAGASRFQSKNYEVTFIQVLAGVEEIKRKQISLTFHLDQVESQASANKVLRHFYQFFYRFVRTEKEGELQTCGTMNCKKALIAKTVIMLDKITQSYDRALEAIKASCRNFDFAEMRVGASLTSGLEGRLRAVVDRVFAQFPLLLDTAISKDKIIWGTLVPFRFAMRPQRSGDVLIELAHVLQPVQATTIASSNQTPPRPQDKPDEEEERLPHNMSRTRASPLDPVSASMQRNELSTREHVLQRQGEGRGLPVHIHGNVYTSLDVHARHTSETGPNRQRSCTMATSHSSGHSVADTEEEGSKRNNTMQVLLLSAYKPHISIIVDKPSTMKPGAELFSLMMGPRQLSDEIREIPFGTPDMLQEAAEAEAFFRKKNMPDLFPDEEKPNDFGDDMIQAEIAAVAEAVARKGHMFKGKDRDSEWDTDFVRSIRDQVNFVEAAAREEREEARRREREARQRGCPIFLQTAPGIKMLMQIPKVDVNLMLPAFVRFLAAHFIDLLALKEWLEGMLGGEFLEEHLAVGQVVLERMSKYLLLPGLKLNLNLNVRVVAQACEVMFRVDTPADVRDRCCRIRRNRSLSKAARDLHPADPRIGGGSGNGDSHCSPRHHDDDGGSSGDGGQVNADDIALTTERLSEHQRLSTQMTGREKVEGIESALNDAHYLPTSGKLEKIANSPQDKSDKDSKGSQERKQDPSGKQRSDADSGDAGSRMVNPIVADTGGSDEPYALDMAIVLNLMDVVDDAKSILKVLKDAKRAYADHASDKAMMAMGSGENGKYEKSEI
jgi:hypothetical protein